jgi:hypothetical protein
VQKAISMGMLILPPVERTPQLLRDAGLVVLDIADGIRLLLCKVYNVCLEPKPCQVRNHSHGHDDRRAPKRSRDGGRRRVNTIPPPTDFTASLDEIGFTQLQDPRLEKYTTSPPRELLPVVPGILVVNGYRCNADGCAYYCASKKSIANHCLVHHFFLSVHDSARPCQVQRLFKKLGFRNVGYSPYFGVDHQSTELASDPAGLRLKE